MTDSMLWTELSAAWQAADGIGPRLDLLRARVDRETESLRWLRRFEAAVTVGVFGGLAASLGSLPQGERWGWVAAALAHTAVVLVFTFWNRRGIWRPLGATTREYLRLAAERCRRRARTARFTALLLSIEAAAMLAWLAAGGRLSPPWVLATGAVVVLVWWVARWVEHGARSSLAGILALSDAFAWEAE
jgi:hypothetical protein